MAKDGTNRGGRRPGAGRKKKPLSEKIKEGKTATVMKLPEPPELETISMPPIKEFMTAEQRMGELHADEIYTGSESTRQARTRRPKAAASPFVFSFFPLYTN